ncbi:MAG TPA: methylenetetrahydrofolate reductase [Planctomycetota bacterium]
MTNIAEKSKLLQALRSQRLTVTAECVPPKGADAAEIKKLAASLPKAITALVVADNHEDIRACALSTAALLARENVETVLTLVTRDRNRIALQSDALGAAALGISNVLCVSGDHMSLGVCPEAGGAFDVDPIQLVQALKDIRDDGKLLGGEKLASAPALFLGGVVHPYLQPMKLNLISATKKIAAGAQFVFTSPVYDVAALGEWMKAICAAGLHEKAAILATVRPLASAKEAEELQKTHKSSGIPESLIERLRKASDPAKEGVAIAAEIAAKIKEIPGIKGIHILSGGRADSIKAIVEQAGL